MKNKPHIFWGLLFIAAAALILISQFAPENLEVITPMHFVLAVLMVVAIIKSIPNLFWPGIWFPLGGLYLIAVPYSELLSRNRLSVWQVLVVALLASIGFSLLFKRKHKWKSVQGSYHGEQLGHTFSDSEQNLNGQNVYMKTRFGEATRYVKSQDLVSAQIDNSFGESSVYFDEVRLGTGDVEIRLSNSFGELTIYLPKEWNIENDIRYTFASVREIGQRIGGPGPKVRLTGSASFGEIRIIYV